MPVDEITLHDQTIQNEEIIKNNIKQVIWQQQQAAQDARGKIFRQNLLGD